MKEEIINKQRIAYVDLAGGIMIIMMMYSHALYPMWETQIFEHIPYLYFFMPWFFYKSGMMFTPKDAKTECINGVKKLLKTFAIWSLIGYAVYIIMHWYFGNLTLRMAFYSPIRSFVLKSSVPIDSPLWFLPILFLVRQVANYLIPRVKIQWLVIAALCAAILLRCFKHPLMPTWIYDTAYGLFFFFFAYWVKNYETNKWLIVVSALVYIASVCPIIDIATNDGAHVWTQILYYPACAFSIVLFNNICRWLIALTDRIKGWRYPIISYVGKNAMHFYVPHYILMTIAYAIIDSYSHEWYSGWQGLLIVTIVFATMLPLIKVITNKLEKKEKEYN